MTTKNIESILLVYTLLTIFFIIGGVYSKTEIVPYLTAVMSMGYVIGTYYLIIRCKDKEHTVKQREKMKKEFAEETTNIEKMTTRQLIHNFYHQLRIRRRQSNHGEKIFITKFIDIPKQVTTNHELLESKEEKQEYIKEYIIKKYYFKTYPCSIEILDYIIEKTEYGLYDILHVHYIIREDDYLYNLEKIIDDYITD